jgi:multidrug efflux system membrane fusion protein
MRRTSLPQILILPAALAALVLMGTGCSKKEGGAPAGTGGARGPVPVVLARAAAADVPVELRAVGTVEPVQSAPIRAQVGGTLIAVSIREGEVVRQGQVLFQIDSRTIEGTIRQLEADLARYEAQERSAEAQVRALEAQVRTSEAQARAAEAQAKAAEANSRSAEAQAELADTQAKRYESLSQKDYVTREQYDQVRTGSEAAKAALTASRSSIDATRSSAEAALSASEGVKAQLDAARASVEGSRASQLATRAAIENAKVQLSYTEIRSPVSGQAGSLLAKAGDLVKANDTPLVVVNQVQPILVRFTVPEKDLPDVQRRRKAGSLAVRVEMPGGAEPRTGRLVFVDNAVDRATGTIVLKAQFDNGDNGFWPGQFVDTVLTLRTIEDAVTVPPSAVVTGQKGPFIFVVDTEMTAAVRPVKPGLVSGSLQVIDEGLSAGETVVTDGQLRLVPGAKVAAKAAPGSTQAPEAEGASK